MRIITWNVNGLRAVLKKGFTDWLADTQPDILCLQETRVDPGQLDAFWRPLGYHACWHAGRRPGYSGVGLLSRRELPVRAGLGIPEFDAEGRTLIADLGDFVLFNAYFPNGSRDLSRIPYKLAFYAALLEEVDRLQAAGRPVVIGGDFNTAHQEIDLAHPRENREHTGFRPEERAWVDTYLAHGLVDAFRSLHPAEPGHYTWWSMVTHARERNVGWRIDYFLVSAGLMPRVGAAYHLPDVMGSDHCPVALEIEDL